MIWQNYRWITKCSVLDLEAEAEIWIDLVAVWPFTWKS